MNDRLVDLALPPTYHRAPMPAIAIAHRRISRASTVIARPCRKERKFA